MRASVSIKVLIDYCRSYIFEICHISDGFITYSKFSLVRTALSRNSLNPGYKCSLSSKSDILLNHFFTASYSNAFSTNPLFLLLSFNLDDHSPTQSGLTMFWFIVILSCINAYAVFSTSTSTQFPSYTVVDNEEMCV